MIASLVAPTYAGGLAAYSRLLAEGLGRAGFPGVFSSVFENHPTLPFAALPIWPVHQLANSRTWQALWRPFLSRLASRPSTHSLLERLVRVAIPDPLPLLESGSIKTIHFVGTGWDFIGFRLLHAARQRRLRFTVTPAVHPDSWGDDAIDIRLYRQADRVFCLSEHEGEHLIRKGVPEEKIARCGLPPMCRSDGDAARLRQDLEIGSHPAVLFLGRRDSGKGYPALLEAWPQVIAVVPEAILLVAGPGGKEHESLKTRLPSPSIRDLGIPDEQTKADALATCDVFCLPSAHESFGIVFVEAWSYGKPVISGTAPACRELIKGGNTGLWADQNPETLAEKLIFLLRHPAEAKRMGEAGKMLQQTTYTVEAMLQTHLDAWGMAPHHAIR